MKDVVLRWFRTYMNKGFSIHNNYEEKHSNHDHTTSTSATSDSPHGDKGKHPANGGIDVNGGSHNGQSVGTGSRLRLTTAPKMRLEVMQKYECLGLVSFVLLWWLALFLILWTAPSWTIEDYVQSVAYCNPVYSTDSMNNSFVTMLPDCDFTCYYQLDSMQEIYDYLLTVPKCEIADNSGYFEALSLSSIAGSCPYNRTDFMELDMSIPPPSIEITLTDFDAFYPLLGRFDTYIQLNRKEGEYYNGEPYELTLHYSIVVTGRRINKQVEQLKTIWKNKKTYRCAGNNATCHAMLLPAEALEANYCADLGDYETINVQVFFYDQFSPLQPSLDVQYPQFNSTEQASLDVNEYNILFRTTSYPFMYAISAAHMVFLVLLVIYNVFFIAVTFKFLNVPFSRFYVERKWSILLNACSFFVGGDIMYLFLVKAPGLDADGIWSYSTNLLIADQFMVNMALGIILFLNLCFIANFRNSKYSEHLPWGFYFDKLVFLFVWVFVTVCGTAVTTAKVTQAITSVAVSHIRTAGQVLTCCLMTYYFLSVLVHTAYTASVLRGQWNFGVRHRQLGFRFMAWLQVMSLILFLSESIAVFVAFPNRSSVSTYGAYTGFQTLFIETFAFNIFVVCMVLATTWCYLPPGRHSLQDEAESSVMTNHTHVRGTFSLYTAHKMVGCASVAYRDPPNTRDSLRGVLDCDKYGITLLHFISVEATDIHCVVFLQDDQLVVSFRGTASKDNALTDLKANLVGMCGVPGALGKHSCERGSECRAGNRLIHRGFNLAYASVRDVLFTKLRPLVEAMAREHERVQQKHSGGRQSQRKCTDMQPAALKCICIGPDGRVGEGGGEGEGAVGETHCVCRGRLGARQTVERESDCVEGTTDNELDTQTQTHARKHSRKTAVFRSYTTPDKAERLSEAGFVHNPYYGPGGHGVVGSGGNPNIDLTRGAEGGESAQASVGAAAGEGAHGMGATRDTVSGNHVRTTDQQAEMGKDVDGSAMDVSAHHDSVVGEGVSHQEADTDFSPTRERRVDEGAKGNPGRMGKNSLASLKALFSGIGRKESIAEGTGERGADGGTQPPTQHPTEKHTQQHTAKPTNKHARRLAQSYDTALAQEVVPEDSPQSSPWARGGAAEGSVSVLPEGVVQPTDDTYPHVFITGHSLGGSLATLFALDCAIRFPELKSTVYTFGSPRVGNKNFAAFYDEKVPHTFRLVNDGDVVTGVPKFKGPSFLNITYKHVGTCYVLSARGDLVINPNFPERFLKVAATINPQSHLTAAYRNSIAGCIGSALRRQRGNDNETMLTALQTLTTVLQAPSYMCKDIDRDVDGGQAWAGSHATFDRTIASGSRRVARRQHTTVHESLFTMRKMHSVRRRVSNFALASKSKSDADTLVNDSGVPEATGTDQGRRRVGSLPGVQIGDGTASTTQGTHLETREAGIYEPGHASIRTASGGDQGNHGNLSMSSIGAGYARYDAAAEVNNSESAFPSSSSTTAAEGVQSHSLAMNPETTLSPLERDGNTKTLAQSSERQTSTLPSNRHTAGGSVPPRRKSDGVDMKAIVNQVLANGNNVSFDVIAGGAGARLSETELSGSGGAVLNKGAKKALNVEGGMPQLQETRSVRYKQSGKPLLQHALENAAQEELAVPAYEHTVIAMNAQQMAELEMVQRDTERTREPLSASLSSFVDKNVTGIAQKFRDSVRRRHGTPSQSTDRLPKGLDDLESSMGVEMTTVVFGGEMLNDESGSVAEIDTEIVNSIPQLHTTLKNKGDG